MHVPALYTRAQRCREEQALDQAELSPESLAAKQAVMTQIQQFQAKMGKVAESVPEEKQGELMDAVSEAMKAAASQVHLPLWQRCDTVGPGPAVLPSCGGSRAPVAEMFGSNVHYESNS